MGGPLAYRLAYTGTDFNNQQAAAYWRPVLVMPLAIRLYLRQTQQFAGTATAVTPLEEALDAYCITMRICRRHLGR